MPRHRTTVGGCRDVRKVVMRACHDSGGNSAIEFAFIAPVVILMMIGVVDFGLATWRNMQVHSAAQAGAQYAMAHGFNPAGITAAVTNATAYPDVTVTPAPNQFCGCPSADGVTAASCTASCPTGGAAGAYVTVSAQATYTPLLPYPLIPNALTLTAQSTVRTQ